MKEKSHGSIYGAFNHFHPQMSMKLSSNEAWWAKLAIKHGKIVLNS